jgi:chromosome segregation ATPase
MEKKFVTFPHKEKMITLQDTTSEPDSVTPEDFNDISKVILQENQKSISRMQNEFDEVIKDKNKEISRLKEHSQKLLNQIKKSKNSKQCIQKLEQEKEDLKKKFKKHLSEQEEENVCLKNRNQRLLEQIRMLKEEESEKEDKNNVDKSDKEENSRLKVHNQSLLTQITKLKSDKKSLQNKLEQLINKESLVDKETMTEPMELEKSLNIKIPIMDKGINSDPINLTTQKDANPTDVKRSLHVEVETSQGYEEDSIPKVNQEKDTSIRSKDRVARTPYRHPNHKSRYFNQSMYQQKQMTDMAKNITSSGAQSRSYHGSRNTSSFFQKSYKHPVPQKIELGWADSFTIRQFCSTLRHSYRLVSSILTTPKTKSHAKTLRARTKK